MMTTETETRINTLSPVSEQECWMCGDCRSPLTPAKSASGRVRYRCADRDACKARIEHDANRAASMGRVYSGRVA